MQKHDLLFYNPVAFSFRFMYSGRLYSGIHMCGDAALNILTEILRRVFCRFSLVARYGGDEFIVFAEGLPSRSEAEALAAAAIREMSGAVVYQNVRFYLSASIGCAFYPDHADNIETLIKNADTALYNSKKQGKNIHTVYSPSNQYLCAE